MTEEQKQALIGLCKIEINRWKAASESDPNRRYMAELMEIALASLTAQPIGRVDRGAATDSNEYPDARVVCLHEHVGWEAFQDGRELFTRPAPAADLAEMCDRQYIAGLQAGFRLGDAGDSEGLLKATANYRQQIIDSRQSITCAATMRNIEEAK